MTDLNPAGPGSLRSGFSLSAGWKEARELDRARTVIAPGTRFHIGFTDSGTLQARVATARAVREAGFMPVPVIAARRLRSEGELREYLARLRDVDASGTVLIVGGDPEPPRGPYPDAASVIGSGMLEEQGVREVCVAAHPGGHPVVADDVLWAALAAKIGKLERLGLRGHVVTQFEFDPGAVLMWLAALRARCIGLPVRVGVPCPASTRQLLAYASRCGVTASAQAARRYGLSSADPASTVTPDRFIHALESGYDPRQHGDVRLNFDYPTGGLASTLDWMSRP